MILHYCRTSATVPRFVNGFNLPIGSGIPCQACHTRNDKQGRSDEEDRRRNELEPWVAQVFNEKLYDDERKRSIRNAGELYPAPTPSGKGKQQSKAADHSCTNQCDVMGPNWYGERDQEGQAFCKKRANSENYQRYSYQMKDLQVPGFIHRRPLQGIAQGRTDGDARQTP